MPKVRFKDLVEAELAEGHLLTSAVILTQDDMIEISRLLRRNVQTKDELMLACQLLTTISVDGQEISLEPRLLQRLHSRCARTQEFGQLIKQTVVRQVHAFCGW